MITDSELAVTPGKETRLANQAPLSSHVTRRADVSAFVRVNPFGLFSLVSVPHSTPRLTLPRLVRLRANSGVQGPMAKWRPRGLYEMCGSYVKF